MYGDRITFLNLERGNYIDNNIKHVTNAKNKTNALVHIATYFYVDGLIQVHSCICQQEAYGHRIQF